MQSQKCHQLREESCFTVIGGGFFLLFVSFLNVVLLIAICGPILERTGDEAS